MKDVEYTLPVGKTFDVIVEAHKASKICEACDPPVRDQTLHCIIITSNGTQLGRDLHKKTNPGELPPHQLRKLTMKSGELSFWFSGNDPTSFPILSSNMVIQLVPSIISKAY